MHVITNHEKRVAQHLTVRGLEHFLPFYSERSRWTDRTVVVERPLFAGYVFVRYSPQTRLSLISTPGIIRLLGDGKSETCERGGSSKNSPGAGKRMPAPASFRS
jgi:transcription antitermination factor NusG